jgi:predicted O-methyltransferase YrrM
MDILDTRKCNLFNLSTLAKYIGVMPEVLNSYYEELLEDQDFLKSINYQISEVRSKWDFDKGIFSMGSIPSIDWFAFERVLIYVLIRHLKPHMILETGVYYGGNSAFALQALSKNSSGRLISIDYPDSEIRANGKSASRHSLVGESELYNSKLRPGFMVPPYLKSSWHLIEGDSLKVIPELEDTFDLYIHDSDHSMKFLSSEIAAAWKKLSNNALIIIDDIDWSNAFFEFCVKHRLYPLLMTDNGKDNLRVRTGIAIRNHKRNGNDLFT